MQFGVFDHMDRSAVPLDRFYTDRLRLMEETIAAASTATTSPSTTRRRWA